MLALPETGMARSVNTHNVDRDKICDWIEANMVFDMNRISKSDVIDVLIENEVYNDQDFAAQLINDVWSALDRRWRYLAKPLGLSVIGNRITRTTDWQSFAAYGFCLALSCAELYPEWAKTWSTPSSIHGGFFEEVTAESLRRAFAGWTIKRIGWAPDNPGKLKSTIAEITSELCEISGAEVDLHVDENANELGLDLLAYMPYQDGSASFPVLMFQCASGKNWTKKRHTPDLKIWKSVVSFNSNPVRGFAMPFAFYSPTEFRKQAKAVDGVFVDRTRLLRPFSVSDEELPAALVHKITTWTEEQLSGIPRDC